MVILNYFYDLIIKVYSPWCIDCETTSQRVEKLAEHFKEVGSLIFGRIDASLNEHPKLQVCKLTESILFDNLKLL